MIREVACTGRNGLPFELNWNQPKWSMSTAGWLRWSQPDFTNLSACLDAWTSHWIRGTASVRDSPRRRHLARRPAGHVSEAR